MTLAVIAALAAAAIVSGEARVAIDEGHAELSRGFAARNVAVWAGPLDAGLRVYAKGEFVADKAAFLKIVEDELAEFLDPVTSTISTEALVPDGADMVAITREQSCFRLPDRTRTPRSVCYDHSYTEVWRRRAEGWRVLEIRYGDNMTQTVDGVLMTTTDFDREFPPSATPGS